MNILYLHGCGVLETKEITCSPQGQDSNVIRPHLNKMKTCLGADLDFFFKLPQATFVKVPVIFASARGLALLICSGFGFTLPYKCNQVARRGILLARLPSAFYIYKIKWEKKKSIAKKKNSALKLEKNNHLARPRHGRQ